MSEKDPYAQQRAIAQAYREAEERNDRQTTNERLQAIENKVDQLASLIEKLLKKKAE